MSDWTNHGRDRQPRVNLAILPEKLAAAFHRFCQLNPKPCPIIGISEVGNPGIPTLGIDLDMRTDLPRYRRVWRDGKLIEEPTDILAHWRDDLVAFVIGCSFSLAMPRWPVGSPFATSSWVATCRCIAPMCRARRPARSPVLSSCRCDRSIRQTRFAQSRSPLVFPQCTARRGTRRSRPDRHQRHREAGLRRRGDHSADEVPVFGRAA